MQRRWAVGIAAAALAGALAGAIAGCSDDGGAPGRDGGAPAADGGTAPDTRAPGDGGAD